jgi:hypothetical protein
MVVYLEYDELRLSFKTLSGSRIDLRCLTRNETRMAGRRAR